MESTNQSSNQTTAHYGLLIAGLIIAMLFAALEGTIVGTAIPRIVGDLGGLQMMAWLTTAYMLTSTAIVPVAGKLADLLGRRFVYLAGLIIFMVGSALCGLSQSMEQLIIFRAIQGLGGGIMMPMAMIIIGDLFTGKQRAKWQGIFGAIFGLSSVIGPQIGGFIVDHMDWHWIFYINLPVGLVATVFIALGLNKNKKVGPVQFDTAGMATLIIGVVSLLLALQLGGSEYAWVSWQIISLFILAFVSLFIFIIVESKASEPILPIYLFEHRVFSVLNAIGFMMSVGMFGAIMFVPLYMQGVVGVSATKSGTIMTPMMITMIVASIIGGQIVYKIGAKVQIIIGMLILSISFVLLSTMDLLTTELQATFYMLLVGLGIGLVMPILTIVLQESFPKSELAVVTSSSQFFRQIGGTFGATILGTMINYKSEQELNERLIPVLKQLPQQAHSHSVVDSLMKMIYNAPQDLFSLLYNPQAQLPVGIKNSIFPILKQAMVHSLQFVFLIGLSFVIIGGLLTFILPRIKLATHPKENKEVQEETLQTT